MVSVASEPTVLYDASLAPWIIALPAATDRVAIHPAIAPPIRLPNSNRMAADAAGSAMIHGARLAS